MIFTFKPKSKKLTREERLRYVDVLIAEHLFGWKWQDDSSKKTHRDFVSPEFHCGIRERKGTWNFSGYKEPDVPAYTLDPKAAYQVLEWLLRNTFVKPLLSTISINRHDAALVGFDNFGVSSTPETESDVMGDTLPIALCLYALKRKGISLPWHS